MRDLMIKTLRACADLKALALENIESLVDRMIHDNHYIMEKQGFAFYIKCSDETLETIIRNKEYLTNPVLAQKLLSGIGSHVHFFGVYSTNSDSDAFKGIVKGMASVIAKEHPVSVSWYNRTLDRFIIKQTEERNE